MSLLKSAWEIALEKTKDIEADAKKIREDELFNQGRRLAGTYLNELEDTGSKIVKHLKKVEAEERELILNGIKATILSNIALPQNSLYSERLEKLGFLGEVIDGEEGESVALLTQIAQLLEKFIQARDTLVERARAQYQPIFEEKREQMRQKYGKEINLSMDQDPEFIQFLQKNFNQLSNQYQQVLDQAKEQLKTVWNYSQ
ncbi:MAG: DUF6657 family protein [Sphaerochaetaceae bacterium]|jgi:hypothetical protein|nr:hypothetical protein [Sphaerochaetaceae bacterium]HHU87813.1 hypothetical protein [Spirochaetales bacterium]